MTDTKERIKYQDSDGNDLFIGDFVRYMDNRESAYMVCRSIYDEQLFLLQVFPFMGTKREFNCKNIKKFDMTAGVFYQD